MDLDMNATASEPSQSEIRAAPPDHAQQSPGMQLFLVLAGKWLVQCVHVLAKLGVADLLADGPLEVSELAARTSTLAPTLRRVLRATAVVNIFTELGGRGVMLAAILTQQASARGILFDLPDVVVGSKSLLNRAGVGDRVTVVGGDFFDGVPAGADAYVLKTVLQNWNDDKARLILGHVRAAIGQDRKKRLLILEDVIRPSNAWDVGKLVDIDMLVTVGGRGRTLEDWRDLLRSASFSLLPGPDTAAPWTVLEAVPE